MGKRELVLIALFAVAGIVVYQVTAPPLQPGQEGFSFGRVIQNVRRGMQGRNARATVESNRSEPVASAITEVRVITTSVDLTVVGEDRQDAAFALSATSNGVDDQDAKRLAGLTALKVDRTASALIVGVTYPREGRQQGALAIRVPKRMSLRVEAKAGRLEASNLAAVIVKGNRGETTIADVAGEIEINQRGAALRLTRAGSLRLTVINGNTEVTDVRGVASVDASGAKVQLSGIVGPLDLKSRNSDVRLRDIAAMKPPLRLDMQAGELDIDGLKSEARIDGRNTEIRIALARPAPLTIYNSGENILLSLPAAGGYTLDAVATDGAITSEDPAVKVTGDNREHRAEGAVRGGGPTLSLRATRGRIEMRKLTASAVK